MWPGTSSGAERNLSQGKGFSLLELLVSMTILSIMILILSSMVNQTSRLWGYTHNQIEQFREARDAFETMNRRVSQATLNTYLAYDDPLKPTKYLRQSELRFISGSALAGTTVSTPPRPGCAVFFQAPLGFVSSTGGAYSGLENLLNTWGYYIEFNSDGAKGLNTDGSGLKLKPPFVKTQDRYRFRLMELIQPSDSLSLYKYTAANPGLKSTDPNGMNWFTDPLNTTPRLSHVLAENIIALIIIPKLAPGDQSAGAYTDSSLAPSYRYDTTSNGQGLTDANLNSSTQLPPVLSVTMVAVGEASYSRFQANSESFPANLGLSGLFQSVGDTKDPTQPGFARDLQTLQTNLRNSNISYRIFNTEISIKGAKWSRSQTN